MSASLMLPMPEEMIESSESLMLIGEKGTCKTSLLFQCLKTIAAKEESTVVLFIAPEKVMKVPHVVHKMFDFTPTTANKLINVYLPTAEDLLEFLSSVHLFDINPRFIAVDDFNTFLRKRRNNEVNYIEMVSALLALLGDTSMHFSKSMNNPCSVCVSVDSKQTELEERILIASAAEHYFNQVWNIEKVPSLGRRTDFEMKREDGNEIIHFYVEDDLLFLDNIKFTLQ